MNIDAREYFLSKRPASGPERPLYNRIANAMRMRGNITMNQLCEMPEKELKRIRSLGTTSLAIVMEECRNYVNENGRTDTEDST